MKSFVTALFALAFSTASFAQLSGDYYIPQGSEAQGYASLGAAIDDLNANGASGPVNFIIADNLAESGGNLIISDTSLSEANPLTIKVKPGGQYSIDVTAASTSVQAGAAVAMGINNTSHVTIDGSNGDAGDGTRDLTLYMNSTDIADCGIVVEVDASDVAIKNLIIEKTQGDATRAIKTDTDGAGNIVDLLIENVQAGSLLGGAFHNPMTIWGTNAESAVVRPVVRNCEIYAEYRGITTWFQIDATYENNEIFLSDPAASTSYPFHTCIYLVTQYGNTVVRNNVLHAGKTNQSGGRPAGIVVNGMGGKLDIYNNFFDIQYEDVQATPTNDQDVFGIMFNNAGVGDSLYIYHNTFNIESHASAGVTAPIGYTLEFEPMILEFVNNIFVNKQDAANSYVYYLPAMSDTVLHADYNNCHLEGTNAKIAKIGETEHDALSDWQFMGGEGTNSVTKAVEFVDASSGDLHLAGSSVGDTEIRGLANDLVINDIDGDARDVFSPYMGADEAGATDVAERGGTPTGFSLDQNYPNPFNPVTTISFTLPVSARATLAVYNALGEEVAEIVSGDLVAGAHEFRFDASRLSSGVYVYRLHAVGANGTLFNEARKMTLMK
jgi:hypothetical protein